MKIGGLPIYATRRYDSLAAEVVIGAKDHGRTWLLPLLVTAITNAVCALAAPSTPLALVSVPSRPATIRRRGEDTIARIAAQASTALRSQGFEVKSYRLLTHRRRVRDQSGLTARERDSNMAGAFALTAAPPPCSLIVVDDVVTTGASMREAFRLLSPYRLIGGASATSTSL